jgi:CRISPR-associated DxTHG motif protein
MTLLLTFLGTGNYQPCRYRIGDSATAEETFFSAALAAHLKPDQVLSLETRAATDKHGEALKTALARLTLQHQPVPIPEGKSEAELWQIFAALTEHVPQGCTLHLDITHGFRSLPLLGFLAISYLRVTRQITLGGIHYGAWDASDAEGIAPVFDLTPFLTLLDWTAAAEDFLSTGSAARLARLLSGVQQSHWQNLLPGADRSELPKALKSLASSLEEASANLLLLRTSMLAQSAAALTASLDKARSETAAFASPFLEVLQPVKEQLTRFAGTDLATLRDLVAWLAEREQTAAALTLGSEWLTSYVMVLCGRPEHHSSYSERKPYSLAINLLEDPKMCLIEDDTAATARASLETLRSILTEEQLTDLKAAASSLRAARNDLNHAGFNPHPAKAASLVSRAREVAASLAGLPLPQAPS